jgi:regulator of protease activity HflC (stomatin/prohibitin superfamily)
MLKVPVRVINLEVNLEALPSKEGLSIATQMSILFHIIPDSVKSIIANIGIENGKAVITNVLRSAAADVTSNYYAKDMHSGGKRDEIEKAISKKMTEHLGKLGYVVDAVLLKSIKLPIGLTQAIEEKLKAEQEAQRMEFVLTREKSEAERKKIEAQGIKEYNNIISESLTGKLLKYQSIQAFKELSNSNNSKIIITNGSTPLFMSDDKSEEKETAPAATE